MLLVDSPNQGVRGTIATEERGRYGVANRIATQLDGFVVEPSDRGTGRLIPYRLEPFFPFLSLGDRFQPDAPLVPLDLPGGSLKVTVHTPSGEIDELGTHPILQTRTGHPAARTGGEVNAGGGNPSDVLQLTTLSDDFVYRFAEYGRYTVTISGSVPDIRGREYPFAGTFEIWSAETLGRRGSFPCPPRRFRQAIGCPPSPACIRECPLRSRCRSSFIPSTGLRSWPTRSPEQQIASATSTAPARLSS